MTGLLAAAIPHVNVLGLDLSGLDPAAVSSVETESSVKERIEKLPAVMLLLVKPGYSGAQSYDAIGFVLIAVAFVRQLDVMTRH